MNNANMDADIPQRAVSIYGANEGMDDFPVLKAFQQYIDAEQEKARRRILWLGIFFGCILVVVIIVFMVLLHGINTRNQILSDRLFEYATRESDRRQMAPAVAPVQQNDAALKTMADTLLAIQQKMAASEVKPVEPTTDSEQARKMRAEAAKIENDKILLSQEKKRLEAEKERLHQIEVEQQRRKLYPECYEDAESTSNSSRRDSPSRRRTHTLTDDDIREIIREAYPVAASPEVKPTEKAKADEVLPEEDEEGAIEYFRDDEYSIPVPVKGSTNKVKFALPLD